MGNGSKKDSRYVPPVTQLEETLAQFEQFYAEMFARFYIEARFWRETRSDLLIRLNGVEGAVVSISAEHKSLDRNIDAFGTSIPELVRA